MNKSAARILFCVALLFFLVTVGCSLRRTDTMHQSDSLVNIDSSSAKKAGQESDTSYYYYTQAQLKVSEGIFPEAVELMEKASATDPESIYLKKELVSLYLRNNEADKALDTASKLAAKHPKDIDVLLLYAGIKQILKSDPQDVINTYEKVLKLDPKQKNVYLMLGRLYLEKKDVINAFRIYSDLVKVYPDSYVGYFYLGRIHIQRKEYAQAESCFKKSLEIDPTIEAPKFELIGLYKLQKKNDKVIEMYKKIISDNPDNIHAYVGLGLFYRNIGNRVKADQVFFQLSRKMTDVSPLVTEVLVNYIEKNNIKDAITILTGVLRGQPDNSELNYAMAVAYDRIQKKDETLRYLKKVKPDSKFYSIAVIHSAAVLHESKRSDEALAMLENAIEANPDNIEFYNFLAFIHEEKGDFDKAIEVLQASISLDETNTKLHYRLGVVYDKAGNRQESINSMKKVIELEPTNANALNYLGYTYADMGTNLDEAEKLINEALRYKPEDGFILDSLGWVHYQRGNYEKALEYIKKAGIKVVNDPTIFEHLGDVYEKLKNPEKAAEFYKKSLELYKDEPSKSRINNKIGNIKK